MRGFYGERLNKLMKKTSSKYKGKVAPSSGSTELYHDNSKITTKFIPIALIANTNYFNSK